MHPMSFGSSKLANYLETLNQDGLKHLLEIAVDLVYEKYKNDSRAEEAIFKWKTLHFPIDENYASNLKSIAQQEDNEYLRLENAGANKDEYERHYCLMWLFTGLSDLFQLKSIVHMPVYDILYAFMASTNEPDIYIRDLEKKIFSE
ncbi:MAG: hypothetical protein LBU34_14975 [Planctomycetaceae bacterium]|jgi:hypothetical protein|nr:hypothetical protein [Planctomycetaceae bacterium]